MGLFGKRKKDEELGGLMGSVARDVQLAQQAAAKEMASTGFDMSQLGAAMQAATSPDAVQQTLATRERITRLNANGVDTPATIRAVTVGATSPLSYGPEVTFDWTVEPPGGAPYEARSVDTVHPDVVPGLVAGTACTVRVDPGDPQTLMFWGTKATAAPPAADDRIARLTKLQDLRAQGLITDDEFEQRKTDILGGS